MFITFHSRDEILSFVNTCNKFDDAIDIKTDKSVTDAKSVMGMLLLCLDTSYEIIYECFDGEDNYKEFLNEITGKYAIDMQQK
jgi:phosphotransferase system HPr-like phosphotransfer protein